MPCQVRRRSYDEVNPNRSRDSRRKVWRKPQFTARFMSLFKSYRLASFSKDKLKLEFRAELDEEAFADRLFELLAQNRRGSFMGLDEGRARLRRMLEQANWQEPESVRRFLEQVDHSLHNDQREENARQFNCLTNSCGDDRWKKFSTFCTVLSTSDRATFCVGRERSLDVVSG